MSPNKFYHIEKNIEFCDGMKDVNELTKIGNDIGIFPSTNLFTKYQVW